MSNNSKKKTLTLLAVAAALVLAGGYAWKQWQASHANEGLAGGNGRIEATEVDIATKLGGRVEEILVGEGDFVKAGEPLARMQITSLQAQYDEAVAGKDRAVHNVAASKAQVALRQSDHAAALAVVAQREADLDAAQRRLARSETLTREGASSAQELDDDRARVRGAQAALKAAQAQAAAAQAAITAAQAQVTGADSAVVAAQATVQRVAAELDDSTLLAPRDGRVQFRLAQPGEVLGAGGKVLNLVDLADVYMSFFLPETVAGRVALGSEVRIVLDAAPQFVIPAKVSFVSATAQFTPKTVETASERQKLMFRVKAQLDPQLLQKHLTQVKTGLPGQAWVLAEPGAQWPAHLQVKLPE
ncbi:MULTISPECIES: HlyD family secretion protein [Comamonas]|uniref:HlyD family secretion protein n=1 Tax=Comamonas jiangduensis TaxID=1194168 RepID=A0ABV4IB17_9BURK|nr:MULTISPECIES: HlyD family efflux transporter periplasmic adaptor subunit [Comamonas]